MSASTVAYPARRIASASMRNGCSTPRPPQPAARTGAGGARPLPHGTRPHSNERVIGRSQEAVRGGLRNAAGFSG